VIRTPQTDHQGVIEVTRELNVTFPAFLPPFMITEHRWHLACEFSNWITAYIQS
jgi:hypothetical protein